jgi:hypothetical protein
MEKTGEHHTKRGEHHTERGEHHTKIGEHHTKRGEHHTKRGEHHTPAILLPEKKTHPLKRRLGSSDSLFGRFGEDFLAYGGI